MIENNQLVINCVHPQLEFSTVKPVMSEPYINAQLSIETTAPKLEMHQQNIQFTEDSSNCRAEEGLKSVERLLADYADKCMAGANNAAHNIAVEGQRMLHAKKGENVKIEAAKQKIKERPPQTTIKFIPSTKPTITWYQNSVSTNFIKGTQNVNWNVHSRANVEEVTKNSLTVTEVQKAQFSITNAEYIYHTLDERA